MKNSLLKKLKRYFLSGVLVVVPFILTWLVFKFLFDMIDGLLQPLILHLLGYYTKGLGLVIILLLILLAGVLTKNFLGRALHKLIDSVLARLPFISPIYSGAKQLLEAVTIPSRGSFKEVVLVEYPRKGVFAVGMVTKRVEIETGGKMRPYVTVLIGTTPTPFSGLAILCPEDETIPIAMSVEDALKFIVSGGVVSPETIELKA